MEAQYNDDNVFGYKNTQLNVRRSDLNRCNTSDSLKQASYKKISLGHNAKVVKGTKEANAICKALNIKEIRSSK